MLQNDLDIRVRGPVFFDTVSIAADPCPYMYGWLHDGCFGGYSGPRWAGRMLSRVSLRCGYLVPVHTRAGVPRAGRGGGSRGAREGSAAPLHGLAHEAGGAGKAKGFIESYT